MEDIKKQELQDELLDQVAGGTDGTDGPINPICPLCGERVVRMAPPPAWYTDPLPQYTCTFCEYVEW